jgi:hypothetical protein
LLICFAHRDPARPQHYQVSDAVAYDSADLLAPYLNLDGRPLSRWAFRLPHCSRDRYEETGPCRSRLGFDYS